MNKLSDCHIHTSFSSDSESSMETMIEQAIDLGLKSICITDHNDFNYPESDDNGNMLFQLDFNNYILTISKMKELYADKIDIYTGVEQGLEASNSAIINSYDCEHKLDFIIGSSHLVNHCDPYYPEYWEGRQTLSVINTYFDSIISNLSCCHNFDVYGHLDYIIRYAPNQDSNYKWTDYIDQIDCILNTLINSGKGIEINTAALKYGLKETNPAYGIIHRYKQLGGEIITIGSDAHKPEHLAYKFSIIPEILTNAGFNYYTIFKNRKPEFIKL